MHPGFLNGTLPESTPEPQGPGAEFLTGCRLSCYALGVMHTSFLNGTQPESTPEPQGLELSQADGMLSSLVFFVLFFNGITPNPLQNHRALVQHLSQGAGSTVKPWE